MLKAMKCGDVKITGGVFRERMDLDRRYLDELDTGALLQNFHIEAGLPVKNQQTVYEPEHSGLHWGWESPTCQLRGHFLGHWMSACARLYDTDKDEALRSKLKYVVSELAHCQRRNGGEWVGSIPEKFFDIIGDAYEYFMMKFAQESGKSKGQFYTPSEVSRIIARLIGIGNIRQMPTKKWTLYDIILQSLIQGT